MHTATVNGDHDGTNGIHQLASPLDVDVRIDGHAATITVTGEIDAATAPRLGECCDLAVRHSAVRRLVIELGGVSFMDSQGIRVLVRAAKDLGPRGQVIAAHPTSQVRRLLTITGL